MKKEEQRWTNEKLTDNTKIEYCKTCKNCKFRMRGKDNWEKGYCDIFEAPEFKYPSIINNEECEFKIEDR